MPKVTVQKKTQLDANEAFQKVKSLLENDPDLKKLDAAYTTSFDEPSLTGQATGKMFKAHMKVKGASNDASAGSEVEIVVDLPLALVLIKGVVESTLNKKLSQLA